MESEDRKFPIWTLFSLLPGFHAHVRADCSRPSCRLRAGNRETPGIGLKSLLLSFWPRRDVCSLKNRLWTAVVWCRSRTLGTINISKGIPLSNQQSLFPFSILPALVFLFIFPPRSHSFISSPFVRLVTFCQLSSHFAARLHAPPQRLRKAKQAANSGFPPGGAACSLTETEK